MFDQESTPESMFSRIDPESVFRRKGTGTYLSQSALRAMLEAIGDAVHGCTELVCFSLSLAPSHFQISHHTQHATHLIFPLSSDLPD
jgi:hypothetical protein